MDIPLDKLPKQNHNQKVQTSKSQETKIKKKIKSTDSIDKLLDDKFLQLYFDNINNDSSKKEY
tara:strand:- start:289 stop:477 length:189 start_codon:yes stop_codon:yes gene_type:complete